MPVLEPWLDYALIFVILFFPPTLIRLVWRRSLPKATAIVLCVASYLNPCSLSPESSLKH